MPIPGLAEKVYHGTDEQSAESIRRIGLDPDAWRAAPGANGVVEKGFCVSTDKEVAQHWANARSLERRGIPGGAVLEADAAALPLRQGRPGEWTDPAEYFIAPEDFGKVGPGVFR